jgi:hypothetical protein
MRQTHLDAAISKLSELAERAAAAIEALLEADSESVRLRAALETIRLLIDVEVLEMSDRLDRLEELAAGRNGSR